MMRGTTWWLVVAVVAAAALALWPGAAPPSAPAAAVAVDAKSTPSVGALVPEPSRAAASTAVAPPAADAEPVSSPLPPQDPERVPLPTIGGAPADELQQQRLRMLLHAMAAAGLPLVMTEDLSATAWQALDGWLAPLLEQRQQLTGRASASLDALVRDRFARGDYEVCSALPPEVAGEYRSWQHAQDAGQQPVLHLVRIAHGQAGEVDMLREQGTALDRDMARLARDFFARMRR